MDSTLKLALGIVTVALIIGVVGTYALADENTNGTTHMRYGMMGNGIGFGMMRGMTNGNFNMSAMHEAMMGNGAFDMNEMHRAMHGENPDVDMNAMHQRMLAGNITQEDISEMREHCPMMR